MLTIGISYMGGVIATKDVGLSISINLVIFGFAEMVSYIFGAVLIMRIKRKPICCVMAISIALLNILFYFFEVP